MALYYVDNTKGDDLFGGVSQQYPFETIDKAIDTINSYGRPGDGIRIAYTGQDYAYAVNSNITTTGNPGYGWGEGEYYSILGFDPNGGINRPTLINNVNPNSGYIFSFTTDSNYWLVKDLHFEHPHGGNTSWSCYHIILSSGLKDSDTHWKFHACRFDGSYTTATTIHDQGIYNSVGSRSYVEYKHCLFKDLYYPIRNMTSTPAPVESVTEYCIFYNTGNAGNGQYTMNTIGDPVDFTYRNNTMLSNGPSQYTGHSVFMTSGELDSTSNLLVCNNFHFRANYFMRKTNASTSFDTSRHMNTVGYNTWGQTNGSAAGYFGEFDALETQTSNRAIGDYNLYGTHTTADYTSIFKAYADWTYLWPDTGWMVIPDLRPIGWEMTSTLEDPIAGIRGALPYPGIYQDNSVTTNHSALIVPYPYLNTSGGGSISNDSEYSIRGFGTFSLPVSFTTNQTYSFEDIGGMTDFSFHLDSVSVKTGVLSVNHTAFAILHPSDGTHRELECITEIYETGPSTDETSTGTTFVKGTRKLTCTYGIYTGQYDVYARLVVPFSKDRSAWQAVYQYTIS